MKEIRESIKKGCFPEFVRCFMSKMFHERGIPSWIKDALASVNINVP